MKFEFISQNVGQYPLNELCEALEVAPSAYHASRRRQPSARASEDARLKQEILEIHQQATGRSTSTWWKIWAWSAAGTGPCA